MEKLLNLEEMADILGLSPATLKKKCQGAEPEFPVVRMPGCQPRFSPSVMKEFIERHTIKPGKKMEFLRRAA